MYLNIRRSLLGGNCFLKFFHPAFHSITPEGLNSRLTFLQQCTRQGPTNIDNAPDNLAFGRPPVCILRLGDFYHTKIVIDSVGISYEPLVWDLNPEGIGVQPMIATVDLSFKMIGGQSMKGPINKLQNAVSFNFFGNTQIYDERADKIKAKDGKYTFEPGISVMANVPPETINEELVGGINGNGSATVGTDQSALAEKQPEEATNVDSNDRSILKNIKFTVSSISDGRVVLFWGNDGSLTSLTKEYTVKLTTHIEGTSTGWDDVLVGKLSPIPANELPSIWSDNSWSQVFLNKGNALIDNTNKQLKVFFKVVIEIPSEENIVINIARQVSSVDCKNAYVIAGGIINDKDMPTFTTSIATNSCNN